MTKILLFRYINSTIIVNKLEIEKRVMYTPPQSAFVTLKDHKTDFNTDPKCTM